MACEGVCVLQLQSQWVATVVGCCCRRFRINCPCRVCLAKPNGSKWQDGAAKAKFGGLEEVELLKYNFQVASGSST